MSALFSTCYLSVSTIQHIYQAYMYMLHTYVHTLVICCLLHTKKKNKKELLGANVSHVHGEALLRVTSAVFNSYHRGSISRFEEEAELTEDEHDYKPPSCVTVKT